MGDDQRCLSVVIHCHDDTATLAMMLDAVLGSPFTAQVIVVDDGSTDDSLVVARSVADSRVLVLAQPFHQGRGAALRRGFAVATGDFVISQTADFQSDPRDFSELLRPLLEGEADVVYASRFAAAGLSATSRARFSLGERLLTSLSNMTTGLHLTDIAASSKAYRQEAIRDLCIEEDRFGVDAEITAKLAQRAFRIAEVPISPRSALQGRRRGALREYAQTTLVIARSSPLGRRWAKAVAPPTPRPDVSAYASPHLDETLDSLGASDAYNAWVVDMLAPYLGPEVVEIGAGHGALTPLLAELSHVVATEPAPEFEARLRERVGSDERIEVVATDLAGAVREQKPDTFVLVNVLEHLADDVGALKSMRDALPAHGTVILWVPANPQLYSRYDSLIGHYRRYTKTTLRRALAAADLVPVDLRYANAPGTVAWFVVARLLGGNPTSSRLVQLWGKVIVPVVAALERRWHPPFGQSIFCVARPSTKV